MPETKNPKFKTVKKTVKSSDSSNPEKIYYGVNLITSSKVKSEGSKRLLTPIEAERRKAKLMTGTHNGTSSIRKLKKPARKLTLKAAPIIPTAPKSKAEIRRNFIKSQLKKHIELLDKHLFIAISLLAVAGIFAVYSAGKSFGSSRYVAIQIFAAVIGMALIAIMSFIDYRQIAKKYRLVILANAALLLFTYFFGEGVTSETNVNWINLGFIKIQPSEFAKILFIYSFAVHLYIVRDRINKLFTALSLFLHAGLIIGLTFLQKDLGTLTVFLFIFVIMCFVANLNIWYFISGAAAMVIASPFIWSKLNYYQQQRILVPFDPTVDPLGQGIRHQTLRSMTAISLGGMNGSGYMNGEITQGDFFAKHTDMIFATICEEFGFIGGVAVLLMYVYLIVKIIHVAISCDNTLGCFICTGVAGMFIIQIIENIGMCLGIMPVIGITLPFLSYGGSSAISTYIAVGLVVSVSMHKEKTFFR